MPHHPGMDQVQRYLADEVVEDYADGLIERREALRRLGLLGLVRPTVHAEISDLEAAPTSVWPEGSEQEQPGEVRV